MNRHRSLLCLLVFSILLMSLVTSCCPCSWPFPRPEPTSTPTPLPPTHPLLLERAPARGEEAAPNRPIILVFDQPMDQRATEAAFSIEPSTEGSFSWPDPATMVFTPKTEWDRASQYEVELGASTASAEGLSLREPLEFTFATVGYLEVTQVIPEAGTEEVEPDASVTVMFNRPVVPLQLVSATMSDLPTPLSFDPPVEGEGEWINTSIFVFKPATGFTPSETYRATVPAGLSDTTGGVLQEDFSWTFTVQSPYVVWTEPGEAQDQIALTQPITITFSQPMNRASVRNAFSLKTAGGSDVSGRFEWSQDDTTATFLPEEPLELGTQYDGRISRSARAAVGNAALREEYRWSFRTVPYPRIVDTYPVDGETAAPPETSFEIGFSAPMDLSTLMPNITILPEPTKVYTYWQQSDNRFVLSWDIEPSTSYNIRLGGAMADPYGNTIGTDQVIRFTTRALDPATYLVVPGDVGTYNGYTNTQVYAAHLNTSRIDLELYELEWDDFMHLTGPDRWKSWDEFEPQTDATLLREWSLPAEAPLNETRYTRIDLAQDGGALPPGLYFLQASAPEVRQQEWYQPSRHLLVVSRAHLTLKLAQREALVWATDLASGEPLDGLKLTLFAPTLEGRQGTLTLARGTTDSDGVLEAEFEPLEDTWAPYTVLAGEPGDDDFAVTVSEWYQGIGPWDFDLPSAFNPNPFRLYVYTDRPIYRPGQPVYFRGVVRAEDDARYTLPQELNTVAVTVFDDQGQKIYSDELPLSEFGTFDGEFSLGEEATLGYYYIEARIDEQADGVGFQVAEYRRPEFEVTVTADQEEVLAGERVNVAVEASYFFGGPVTNADVTWNLLAQDYSFRPDVPGWWDWSDTSRWDWWQPQEVPGWGKVIADGEGTTDDQGRFVFSVSADVADSIFSQQFTIEATVTDISDQSVSNRTSVIAHKGLFYIGLRPTRYVGQVGEEQTVEIRTVDWDGQPVGRVELEVTFNQREWLNVQEEDEVGNLYWTWVPSDTVAYSQTVTTNRDGAAIAAFVPESGGTYIVRAEGSDEEGNDVVSATWLWISSRRYVSWRQDNNDRIQLIADRRSYEPGDVAEILVPSPFQGEVTALFTVERGRVIEHWVQTLRGNAETIELPIDEDYAPNVYVSVVLVKGVDETNPLAAYRVGYVSFDVSTVEQELTVTVTPDRDLAAGEHYGPRETVSAEIEVTDADGQPAQAEVGLAVVDKSVLSLAPANAPAIVDAFYGERSLGVRTADSLSLSVDRITARVADEAKGGGGGGPEMAMGAEFIRQRFPDTALWAPSVRTDEEGRASVEFTLPDQLTTWRIDARAVTVDTLVGQVELDVLSTKDLLVQPVTPRFFVVGDQSRLAAVVHNNTGEELTVEVRLEVEGVTLESDVSQTVALPAGGKERVEWTVSVQDARWADLTFYAQGDGYRDAVKPPAGLPPDQNLPIYRYSAPETVGTAGQISEEGTVLEAVALPPSLDTTQGELTVRIEPSLAAGMTGGLDYLEHYPYECTEQVVSRFLPNVLTFRALSELGLEDPDLEANLRRQVGVGLQRLHARQHYDGGWGWWVNDESNALITAYVVFGLVKADEAGFDVDEGVLERGIDFLREQLSPVGQLRDTAETNRRAFVLYVLAEAGEAQESHLSALYELRGRLGVYGKAYLAMAFGLLDEDDPRIRTLLSDLNSTAIVSASGARWQEKEKEGWNWSTDTRTTAIVLDALARLKPDSSLAPQAVRWLMQARTADHWETTQETAWSLIALTDWMVATGELDAEYGWGVRLNGENLTTGEVTPETVREVEEIRVAVTELLLDEANRIEITRSEGPGNLYYTAHLQAYLPVEEVQALNRGIVVGRSYELAECEQNCAPISEAQVGDLVRVRLTLVAPYDLNYVVVEDPFPAGAEPVDTSLQTTSVVGERPELERTDAERPWWYYWGWGWWWFSNTDLRDEKLVLFATSLPAGTYEYTYLLQIGMEGEYKVIPATAYEMYFPEVMGRSDGMIFTVTRE